MIALTSLAALAALLLAALTDLFQEYGGLSLMLITIFAFVVFRLRFVFAIAVGPIYVLMFVALSLAAGSEAFALQTSLVISAILVATVGTRMLESVSRDRYVQRFKSRPCMPRWSSCSGVSFPDVPTPCSRSIVPTRRRVDESRPFCRSQAPPMSEKQTPCECIAPK